MIPEQEEIDVAIEQIIDSRIRRNTVEYLIKWQGYESDDNTWEKEKDLIEDGFLQQINEYKQQSEADTEVDEAPATTRRSKTAGDSSRSRSKTPVRKTKASKVKEEEVVVQEDVQVVNTQEFSYETVKLPNTFWLSWLLLYVASILCTVVAGIARTSLLARPDTQSPRYLDPLQTVSCLPYFVCLFGIYKRPLPSYPDLTNRVLALNLWLGMMAFFENGLLLFPYLAEDEKVHRKLGQLILFSLGMTQLLSLLVVNAHMNLKTGPNKSISVTASIAGIVGVCFALAYLEKNYIHLDEIFWAVAGLSCLSVYRAFYDALMKPDQFMSWLVFYGAISGLAVTSFHLLRAAGYVFGRVEQTTFDNNLILKMNGIWLTEQILRWTLSASFTYLVVV